MHHFGVERSLYLARKLDPLKAVSKAAIKNVVSECQRCQMIDPAPTKHNEGTLSVAQSWKRLVADVTHYRNKAYLTMVDFGLGRFAL